MLEAESEMELSCSATVHPVASDLLSCPESVRMQEWERDSVHTTTVWRAEAYVRVINLIHQITLKVPSKIFSIHCEV